MNHEEKIHQIETETAELKHQIMKLEFQHKKDIVEAEKKFNISKQEFNERHNKIQKHLDYITRLAGITYEELDLLDEKITRGGEILASPRKRV